MSIEQVDEPVFKHSARGASAVFVGGYRFSRQSQLTDGKVRWHCGSHRKKECTVYDDRPRFFTTEIGARAMQLRGYCYTRHSVCSSRVRWLCAESGAKDCHALITTIGRSIVDKLNTHNHPPAGY
ncbi:FLYWCH zinc finger domain-containing protein [Phthorimaea operculella]|nr:FLYWCH zinc finger domain-containing protein [Phthorimaea operculella]